MRTEGTLANLVAALQRNCGDMYDACQQCMVSPVFVTTWMKDDADVRAAIQEAERVGSMQIESAALKRAVVGYEKDVYYKGAVVGQEIVYSDGLMQTLLKGRLSERYGKDADSAGGIVVHGQAQINIMPRANSYDEWLNMKSSTLAKREELPALGGPVIDAVAVPASPLEGLGL